jgi:predicted nucleic acid-binding protein
VLDLAEKRIIDGIVAGHAFDTLFYIVEKAKGTQKAHSSITFFHKAVRVGTVNQQVIDQAVKGGWKDFEDAVHHACAVQEQCDVIITHNQRDFEQSTIPVVSAAEFISNHMPSDPGL